VGFTVMVSAAFWTRKRIPKRYQRIVVAAAAAAVVVVFVVIRFSIP